jgi:ethanolamine utilization microcompartment shell protein EutL
MFAGSADTSYVATKVVGILALSDNGDVKATLASCFKQLNVILSDTGANKTVFHAYDAVERTQFTFVLAPEGLERDLFFALELAKSVDILMFAANSNSTMIDEASLPSSVRNWTKC